MKSLKIRRLVIVIFFMFLLLGCQTKYNYLVSEIKAHNLENVKKGLNKKEKLSNEEKSWLFEYAVTSYKNDKKGLIMLKALDDLKEANKYVALYKLCNLKGNILERVKYFTDNGLQLYDYYWSSCMNHKKVYDYYHIQIEERKAKEEAKKEADIALKKKKAKRVFGITFTGYSALITDVEKGASSKEILAHSARVDRINTGTFEFYGFFHMSGEKGKLYIDKNTKFYIDGMDLPQIEQKKKFYETIAKPSSYYTVEFHKNRILKEVRAFTSHIYYSAEELHESLRQSRGY